MVYDEGWDVTIGNQSYFDFSKYIPKTGGPKNWDSVCYATLNGWYRIGNKWGCFVATKKNVGDPYRVTNAEVENKTAVVEPGKVHNGGNKVIYLN